MAFAAPTAALLYVLTPFLPNIDIITLRYESNSSVYRAEHCVNQTKVNSGKFGREEILVHIRAEDSVSMSGRP